MKILNVKNSEAEVVLSKEELLAINNALNEAGEIDDFEFETRIGVKREVVEATLSSISELLDRLKK
jgi:hypothetical protein